MQQHEEKWIHHFVSEGYPAVEPLSSGMEGAVYRLDDQLIAKVWGDRSPEQLHRLKDFYAHLDTAGLPFATPLFHEIREAFGRTVTVERWLPGVPLDDKKFRTLDWPTVTGCLSQVLSAFADVPDAPELRRLPVLSENNALWSRHTQWPDALTALVRRRVAQFGDQLQARVPGLDVKLEKLCKGLSTLDDVRPTLMHGDLTPGNILVGEDVRPVAVLDFGFLSGCGDPAFDAAVAGSIFDMYSPAAQETEARLDEVLISDLGHTPHRLALYRAAYAVITSNAYDPAGQDGHFQWCIDMLSRDSVADALRGL
ncbi:phosphotransferase family protein [Streptomyces sp. NPDC102384]|uniref:phosphotransferase family protein n=1 Tax=Streptomyces sp. NPDC102384 TaxID=3366166 RepID=UPI00380FCACB